MHGLDHLPDGPSIVVANHPSWLDGLALATVLPPSFRFVAGEVLERRRAQRIRAQAARHRVRRTLRARARRGRHRPARRPRPSRGVAGDLPRGPTGPRPGLRPFHMGAFVVAAQAGVPVVPVAIRGTRAILRPEHRFPRRGAVDITLGEPIQPIGHRLGCGSRVAARRAGRRPAPVGGTRRRMTRRVPECSDIVES